MNSTNESIDFENEIKMLKERLNMYKSLNNDLSSRIQDLKVQVGSYASELTIVRRELLDEKSKTSEMRRYIKLLNTQCANFFNTFISNVQQLAENGMDINITALGFDENEPVSITPAPTIDPALRFEKTILNIKNRFQNNEKKNISPEEMNSTQPNLLNTILEESQLLITSTPYTDPKNSKFVENDENSTILHRRKSQRNSSLIMVQTPVKELLQKESTPSTEIRQLSSSNKPYTIFEDHKISQKEMSPCFVRLSRCPLADKMSNANNQSIDEKNETYKSESEKGGSEERELPIRPKRSKRPRSGTLTERSVRTKLRRS